eukprot:3834922-Pleurochrysis_carterae.AAC.1
MVRKSARREVASEAREDVDSDSPFRALPAPQPVPSYSIFAFFIPPLPLPPLAPSASSSPGRHFALRSCLRRHVRRFLCVHLGRSAAARPRRRERLEQSLVVAHVKRRLQARRARAGEIVQRQ